MTSSTASQAVTPPYGSVPLPEIGWAQILRAWCRWSVGILLAAVLGGVAAFSVATRLEPTYVAEAVLLYDRPDPGRVQNAADPSELDSVQRAWLARSQVDILRSNELARRVIEQLMLSREPMFRAEPGLRDRLEALLTPLVEMVAGAPAGVVEPPARGSESDRLVRAYLDRLTVRQEAETYVLRVGFRAPEAELAARVANAHAEAYLADLRERRASAVAGTSSWLEQAVAGAQSRVVAAEDAIDSFRGRVALVDLDGRTALDQSLAQMTADLAAAQAEAVRRQARANQLLRLQAAGQVDGIIAMSDSRVLADLRDKQDEAATIVAGLSRDMGARHPQLLTAESRRAELAAAVRAESRNIVDGEVRQAEIAVVAVAELRSELNQLKQEVLAAGSQRAELARLQAAAEAERGVYFSLVQKLRSFDRVGELVKGEASLLSSALAPNLPSAPRRGLFAAFGFCLAGGLAAGGLAWREGRRDVVRHTGDATIYSGAQCLAVMPAFERRWDGSFDRSQPKFSFFHEQLRSLCAVLGRSYTRAETSSVSLLVTSSLPGEGKSTFCGELGRFAAQNGLRCLIVNADPKVMSSSDEPLDNQVIRLESDLELFGTNLAPSLTALWHLAARSTIDDWQREFDLVIIDTPPLSAAAESIVLAPIVDAAIIVTRVDLAPRTLLASVGQELEKAGGNIAGFVLSFARLNNQRGVLPSDLGYYFSRNKGYHKRLAAARRIDQS